MSDGGSGAGGAKIVRAPPGALAQWRIMGDLDLLTAADVQLMQGLAQRVTAVRPDRVNGASRGARAV
jgi:hypothetical protein